MSKQNRWRTLRKCYVGLLLVAVVCMVLVFLNMGVAILLLVLFGVGVIVLAIIQMTTRYRHAKLFRNDPTAPPEIPKILEELTEDRQ